jgi:hypothetical protein
MRNHTVLAPHGSPPRPDLDTLLDAILAELRAIRQQQARDAELLNEFRSVYLRSRFPFGKPSDRWAGRG